MPLYGSTGAMAQLLRASTDTVFSEDDTVRLAELQRFVSALIESETGAVFYADDADVAAEVRIVDDVPLGATLYLPVGLRSLESVTAAPVWNGTTWSGGTLLDPETYRLAGQSRTGVYRTILAVTRFWPALWTGQYAIEGIWEDQVTPVPAEIDYIANYMAAELYKVQGASPAGFTGPDGLVVPIRNVLKAPEVVKVFDQHRVGVGVWF